MSDAVNEGSGNSPYEYISKKDKLAGKDIWVIYKRVRVSNPSNNPDIENKNPWVRVGGTRYYSTAEDAKIELDILRGKTKSKAILAPQEKAKSESYEHVEGEDMESDVDPSQQETRICESLVNCAIQEKTAEFKHVFEAELNRRINAKIEEKRAEVAKELSGKPLDSAAA